MGFTMLEKIKHWYWRVIPYQYRPSILWYKFRCFIWKRYTTIKPRYLSHVWHDRVDVLPHMMFEILSQFIEQECSPGYIDWEASDHLVEFNGKSVNVRDEMQELYDWWHTTYMKEYTEVEEILWKEAHKHEPIDRFEEDEFENEEDIPQELKDEKFYTWEQDFKTTEDEEIYDRCMMALGNLEHQQNQALLSRMHRLVNLTNYLWT
jgi:hypothetical protein